MLSGLFLIITFTTLFILSFFLFHDLSEDHQLPCGDSSLHFASYYGDHMVLQKSPESAQLWGCAPQGADVTVSVMGPTHYKTKVASVSNETGMWRVTLDPVEAGGPYDIIATAANASVALRDVLFGDVWLCGGQSNMYFPVSQVFNASVELAAASEYPHVRFFMAGLSASDVELRDLIKVAIPWSVPSEKNLSPFSAVCWLFGRYLYQTLHYPVGLVQSSRGATTVEAWSSLTALRKCGLEEDSNFFGSSASSVLWNAMIHPLLSLTIKGAIWYQGEQNKAYHRDLYNCTFPAMIDDWRAAFHRGSENQTATDFPFGFVQLSTAQKDSRDDGFPEIRWHQTADYGFAPNPRMKKTFMAVALDLPDETSPYGSLHPRHKRDVAYRLWLGAKAVAYNYTLTINGPFPFLILADKMFVTIIFDQALSVTPSKDVFEICCAVTLSLCGPTSTWLPAPVAEWDGDTVRLFTGSCPSPGFATAVRYAWRDWPCDFKACPVYGAKTSLPAPPFIVNFDSSTGWKRNVTSEDFLHKG